jgi:hypothetical protein
MAGLSLFIMLCYGGNRPMEFGLAPNSNGNAIDVLEATGANAHTSIFPWKKKKGKNSNKVKKHNRSMGKKFKRKNEDTLRR